MSSHWYKKDVVFSDVIVENSIISKPFSWSPYRFIDAIFEADKQVKFSIEFCLDNDFAKWFTYDEINTDSIFIYNEFSSVGKWYRVKAEGINANVSVHFCLKNR